MPVPKRVLNAFTAKEVQAITGLSLPMIDYLLRAGFLTPAYGAGTRGQVRYYSYRDLVAARLVQQLRETGVELSRLKRAVAQLCEDAPWSDTTPLTARLDWLVSDGKEVLLRSGDGFLDTLRRDRQRSFAFVVNLPSLEQQVRTLVPKAKRTHFTMENRELRYAGRQSRRSKTGD